jgi:hypothetical protein
MVFQQLFVEKGDVYRFLSHVSKGPVSGVSLVRNRGLPVKKSCIAVILPGGLMVFKAVQGSQGLYCDSCMRPDIKKSVSGFNRFHLLLHCCTSEDLDGVL